MLGLEWKKPRKKWDENRQIAAAQKFEETSNIQSIQSPKKQQKASESSESRARNESTSLVSII
jgi:hypothetical protein